MKFVCNAFFGILKKFKKIYREMKYVCKAFFFVFFNKFEKIRRKMKYVCSVFFGFFKNFENFTGNKYVCSTLLNLKKIHREMKSV